ncbi:hypothetical protein [Proteus mirabilis]|nr:hypothetical protein [Proteus mirabilis]MDC9730316.1 hypothetical protein [Proteus mirabilis]MDK6199785.1 hypothetical protein [Proteus mirabilis]MDM3636338.1 hypothetical protein [Proteus mirabilis]MDM3712767.1 hypothetical protein [Proteus mirabilis]MDM3727458.1 hypothetical protein [Proteus mirabilis]
MSRAGYGVISSLMVLFAIIQAVQPRSDKNKFGYVEQIERR